MAIILASTSAIRQSILRAAGVTFSVRSPDVDEASIQAREKLEPGPLAARLAQAKASRVSETATTVLVIGADQVLAIDGMILNKPANATQAREHLEFLRGRTHTLHSAVACAKDSKILWSHADTARMTMRRFSDTALDRHIAKAGSTIVSSVGAYKIEDHGIQLFDKIEGSYFSILGLPLLPLLAFLRDQGELES